MRKLFYASLVFSLLPFAAGCAKVPAVSLAVPSTHPSHDEYRKLHERWTRHGQIVYDFDSALTVDGTMLSPEFRAAYAERFIHVYNVPSTEQDAMRSAAVQVNDYYEFHVEAATHAFEIGELANKRSVWRITLLDDGGREVAASELKEKKERKEFIERFYPNTNEFTRSWKLRFPAAYKDGTPLVGEGTKHLTLRFAGPAGSVDLKWDLVH